MGDLRSSGDTDETAEADALGDAQTVTLRMQLLMTGPGEAQAQFYYHTDGRLRAIGSAFTPGRHTWVGARIALFCTPFEGGENSWADFSRFCVTAEE